MQRWACLALVADGLTTHAEIKADGRVVGSLISQACVPGTHDPDGSHRHCRPWTCDNGQKVWGLQRRERREIHDWSDAEFEELAGLFRRLKKVDFRQKPAKVYPAHFGFDEEEHPELKGDQGTSYVAFTERHLHSHHAHMSDDFLPWHRRILADMETQLQIMSGDCSLTLPYWNWGYDADNFATSVVFTEKRYGSWKGGCVTDGIGGKFDYFNDCLIRDPPKVEDANRNFPSWSFMEKVLQHRTKDFRGVSQSIEVDFGHNCFHCTLNGFMLTHMSTRDPIFWLHHGMIDHMWTYWQNFHRKNTTLVTGCGTCKDLPDFGGPATNWVSAWDETRECVPLPRDNPYMCVAYAEAKFFQEKFPQGQPERGPGRCTCGGDLNVVNLQRAGKPIPDQELVNPDHRSLHPERQVRQLHRGPWTDHEGHIRGPEHEHM
mmetsp:Transcript_10560/g.23286  ORF Transcript_10560/g.23286 Transcript_10560/m.23286 type:complete len:432 (+) Transcript_10560:84-1379(+)